MSLRTREILRDSLESFNPPTGPIFLGGTVKSKWRDKVQDKLQYKSFNPVVPVWSSESQQIEMKAKEDAIASLFVVTPRQSGLYAAAELTAAAIKQPERTVVAFVDKDTDDNGQVIEFTEEQKASNMAIMDLVKSNGAVVVEPIDSIDDMSAAIEAVHVCIERLNQKA